MTLKLEEIYRFDEQFKMSTLVPAGLLHDAVRLLREMQKEIAGYREALGGVKHPQVLEYLAENKRLREALENIIKAEGQSLLSNPPQYKTTYIAKQALENNKPEGSND